MADGRAARWAGHRDRRRAEVVAGAVEVIDRVGPSATVEQIAAHLGTTRQVLYRQFADRADLDAAVAAHASALLVEHLTPQLDVEAGIEAGVRRALAAYLEFVQTHLSLYRFVRAHDAGSAPGAVRRVKGTLAEVVSALARSVLAAEGTDPPVDPDTMAVALVGLADAVLEAWLDEPRGVPEAVLLEQLVRLCTGVVAAATDASGGFVLVDHGSAEVVRDLVAPGPFGERSAREGDDELA